MYFLKIYSDKILKSSDLNISHKLESEKKVIEICKFLNAEEYINPIGGIDLYSKNEFSENNIKLKFLKTNSINYEQFNNQFLANLSIIDIMMFNSNDIISKKFIKSFKLI